MRSCYFFNIFHELGQKKSGIQSSVKTVRDAMRKTSYNCSDYYYKDIYTAPEQGGIFKSLSHIHNEISDFHRPKPFTKDKLFFLGGDHSISVATLAHSLRRVNDPSQLKVIWVDAHADFNTYEKSETKNVHGMPLSYATWIDANKYIYNLYNDRMKLDPKNILYIGLRDVDPYENALIQELDINVITSREVNEDPEYACKRLSYFIDSTPVHLSFDVDALDPTIFPCTGTPVPDGIQLRQMIQLLSCAELQENKIATDIVETNFELGDILDKTTSMISLQTLLRAII